MTTDDRTPETNQDVFDDYVRHVLKSTGIEYINQSSEYIKETIETIKDGDAGPETAIHMIAIAHAKFMFDRVHLPYPDEPDWTEKMEALHSLIADALNRCPDLLSDYEPKWLKDIRKILYRKTQENPGILNDPDNGPHYKRFLDSNSPLHAVEWVQLHMEGYNVSVDYVSRAIVGESMPEGFFVTNLFQPGTSGIGPDWQVTQQGGSYKSDTQSTYQRTLAAFCNHWVMFDAWNPLSNWHRHFVTALIRGAIAAPAELNWDDWTNMLDMCAWLIEESDFLEDDALEEEATSENTSTHLHLPIGSKEHWAWEFGRIAALWETLDKNTLESEWVDLFSGWPNGVTALSFIAPHLDADSGDGEYLRLGVLATLGSQKTNDLFGVGPAAFSNRITDLPLYWLSQLGYLDGTRALRRSRQNEATAVTELVPDDSHELPIPQEAGSNALLIGSPAQIGATLLELAEIANVRREENARNFLSERLGDVVVYLSEDTLEYLLLAGVAFPRRDTRPAQIVLFYSNAVEAFIAQHLKAPKRFNPNERNRIGKWIEYINRSIARSNAPDGRFNWEVAVELAQSLGTVNRQRRPGAHYAPITALPHQVQDVVLGTESTPSIFELILRFAKKWPPKQE